MSTIQCKGNFWKFGCNTILNVTDLVYLDEWAYVEPYGPCLMNGGYWVSGEGMFQCPRCGAISRSYHQPEIETLKPQFQRVEKASKNHQTRRGTYWILEDDREFDLHTTDQLFDQKPKVEESNTFAEALALRARAFDEHMKRGSQ